MALVGDDDVIEQRRAHQLSRRRDLSGEREVFAARTWIAAGMVVDENERARRLAEDWPKDVACGDGATMNPSACQLALGDDAIATVDEECPQLFVRKVHEARPAPTFDLARGANRLATKLVTGAPDAEAELDGGGESCRACEPEPELFDQAPHAMGGETVEAGGLVQEPLDVDAVITAITAITVIIVIIVIIVIDEDEVEQLTIVELFDAEAEGALADAKSWRGWRSWR